MRDTREKSRKLSLLKVFVVYVLVDHIVLRQHLLTRILTLTLNRTKSPKGIDLLVSIGGDGTCHEVVNGFLSREDVQSYRNKVLSLYQGTRIRTYKPFRGPSSSAFDHPTSYTYTRSPYVLFLPAQATRLPTTWASSTALPHCRRSRN